MQLLEDAAVRISCRPVVIKGFDEAEEFILLLLGAGGVIVFPVLFLALVLYMVNFPIVLYLAVQQVVLIICPIPWFDNRRGGVVDFNGSIVIGLVWFVIVIADVDRFQSFIGLADIVFIIGTVLRIVGELIACRQFV